MLDTNLHQAKLFDILQTIYRDSLLRNLLGFKGGTAAMLFYYLPRFSVDLDFDLLQPEKKEIVLKNTGLSLKQALNKALAQIEKVKQTELLQGLGELLDNKQKAWVKEKLKDELLFQIRLYLKMGKP